MIKKESSKKITIKKLSTTKEAETCARITASSEPWKTLGIGYEAALKFFDEQLLEFYIAISADNAIGFIAIQMEGAFTGYIRRIAVDSNWRGKGVGTMLMQFAEERIFSEKSNVFLCVSSFNLKAKKLYEKLGYEIIGEIKNYLVDGYSEILMRKTKGPILNYHF